MIMDHHTWYQSIDYRELESTTRQQAYQYQSMRFDLYPHSSSSYYQPPPTEHHKSTIMVETRQCSIIKPATLEELSKSIDDRFAANKVEMNEMRSKLDQMFEMMKKLQNHTLNPKGKEVEETRSYIHVQQVFTSDVKAQSEEIIELWKNQSGKCLDTAESVTYRLPKQHQDRKELQDQHDTRKQPEIHELPSSIPSKVVLVPTLTGVDVVRRSENQDMIDDVSVYDIQQEVIKATKGNLYEVGCTKEHKVFDEMSKRELGTAKVLCVFYYSDLVNALKVYYDVFVPEIIDWKVIMNGYSGAHARGVRACEDTQIYEGYANVLDNMFLRYQEIIFYNNCVSNYNSKTVRLLALEYNGEFVFKKSIRTHLGTSRRLDQGCKSFDYAFVNGKLFDGEGFKHIKESFETGTLHFIGLVSNGGVHSRLDQLLTLLDVIEQVGGIYLVTADHRNTEDMVKRNKTGQPALDKNGSIQILTSHALQPVPVAIEGPGLTKGMRFRNDVPEGGLANVAATMMNLHGYIAPDDYKTTLIEVILAQDGNVDESDACDIPAVLVF